MSNPAIKVFGPSVPPPPGADGLHARWLWAWNRGLVQAAEAALWCAIGGLHALAAARTRFATALSYAVAAVACGLWIAFTGWYVFDYDLWIGDLWTGSLLVDHVFFVQTGDPITTMTAPPLLAASWVLWRCTRPAGHAGGPGRRGRHGADVASAPRSTLIEPGVRKPDRHAIRTG